MQHQACVEVGTESTTIIKRHKWTAMTLLWKRKQFINLTKSSGYGFNPEVDSGYF